jgi:pimeloyl-ACP methyl ester carboxylesterase
MDTRGHGRSTRDAQPFTYELLASDVLAVMDALRIEKAAFVGWSDGAATALVLAAQAPSRVAGVFYFACNMDPSGVHPFEMTPVIQRCFNRHTADYAQLSATPGDFDHFADALTTMQRTQPDFSADDLAAIHVPALIAHSEHEEFIKREHAGYLAQTLPDATMIVLDGVSHFAPLQRPAQFNAAVLSFLARLFPSAGTALTR